jgi:hypothetical protein
VAVVIFVLPHLSGDPVTMLVPADASPEVFESTRRALGLDRPPPGQFVRYIGRVARPAARHRLGPRRGTWWRSAFPGLAIFVTVLSANMVGDYLRDRLDPQLRNQL